MTMTFKEALIAHLQGEKVEIHHPCASYISDDRGDFAWRDFSAFFAEMEFRNIPLQFGKNYEFRLAPRTILVNGVEVPAPEKNAPKEGENYFLVQCEETEYVQELVWENCVPEEIWLSRGLVYLDRDSAIARAKAMLITQEVK